MSNQPSAMRESSTKPGNVEAWKAIFSHVDTLATLEKWAGRLHYKYSISGDYRYSPVVTLENHLRSVVVTAFDLPDPDSCSLAGLIRLALSRWQEDGRPKWYEIRVTVANDRIDPPAGALRWGETDKHRLMVQAANDAGAVAAALSLYGPEYGANAPYCGEVSYVEAT